MWICISKKAARAGAQIIRQASNFADDLGESLIEAKKRFINDQDNKNNVRSLKIAILGLPNAGKSTLINHLVGRPVCATSSKIHTTRNKAAAVCYVDNTQLIFIDTPGLVGRGDLKKYKLEESFKKDAEKSIQQVDVIGVIQDMTRVTARESINEKLIKLLSKTNTKSILILNKIDTLRNKKLLLEIVRNLTHKDVWPYFSDVFMISALTGDGVDDLKNYFVDSALQRDWDYNKKTFSDQSPDTIVRQIVKAKLLDNLPQEMPYQINVCVEHIESCEDGSINVVTNVDCPSARIARLVIGQSGERIKNVAAQAEQLLCATFRTTIRLKIAVPIKEEPELKKKNKAFR
ncbi:GTPase Era, mitochondrial [Phymastichus coffea]|uniref:GTPase Era, mitochondrial n=1 Tax=Phymastichus coffea TaxID=108790 RepID=UPI00273C119E|nr:GTPase Era, mitochondrial [Phymastichus coffea]XP_058791657.1 GTPase Era, mitochondrial [Phymastichus coffea]